MGVRGSITNGRTRATPSAPHPTQVRGRNRGIRVWNCGSYQPDLDYAHASRRGEDSAVSRWERNARTYALFCMYRTIVCRTRQSSKTMQYRLMAHQL